MFILVLSRNSKQSTTFSLKMPVQQIFSTKSTIHEKQSKNFVDNVQLYQHQILQIIQPPHWHETHFFYQRNIIQHKKHIFQTMKLPFHGCFASGFRLLYVFYIFVFWFFFPFVFIFILFSVSIYILYFLFFDFYFSFFTVYFHLYYIEFIVCH